jgi:O-antigen/teichoic acid export membrane protein
MYFSPIYFFKKTKVLTKVFLFSAFFQIALSIFLIKEWGLWGVVWAGFSSKIVQVFFLWLESRKIFTFKFNAVKLFYLPAIFSMIIILMEYFLVGRYNPLLIHAAELILGSMMVFLVYRKELTSLLKSYGVL